MVKKLRRKFLVAGYQVTLVFLPKKILQLFGPRHIERRVKNIFFWNAFLSMIFLRYGNWIFMDGRLAVFCLGLLYSPFFQSRYRISGFYDFMTCYDALRSLSENLLKANGGSYEVILTPRPFILPLEVVINSSWCKLVWYWY